MQHAWQLIPHTLSPDKRRARVRCDASGIELDRIHPLVQPVHQDQAHRAPSRRPR